MLGDRYTIIQVKYNILQGHTSTAKCMYDTGTLLSMKLVIGLSNSNIMKILNNTKIRFFPSNFY